jgi:hypothetical protein
VSALLHGIYAGDLYRLSARTIFPLLWHLEGETEYGIDYGVLFKLGYQMFNGETLLPHDDIEFALQSDQITKLSEGPAKGEVAGDVVRLRLGSSFWSAMLSCAGEIAATT